MKKTLLIFFLSSTLVAADKSSIDDYFGEDFDLTSELKDKIETQNELQKNILLTTQDDNEKLLQDNRMDKNKAPEVYFKQPEIFTIYTREEIRSIDNIDIIINRGWKSVIVGKHQLVINDEYKIK